MAIEIYLGLVESCPSAETKGRLAYHLVTNGESSIANLNYRVTDKDSLVKILKSFNLPQATSIRNGIPKDLSEGYAPEYKFDNLPNEVFSSIISESGLEDLTTAA